MPAILERLKSQLQAKGMGESQAYAVATEQLQRHGILHPGTTKLTNKGVVRNAMSPAQRAADRAAKASSGNHKPSDYSYNAKTNMATLRSK